MYDFFIEELVKNYREEVGSSLLFIFKKAPV